MLTQDVLVQVLRMEAISGSRDRGCFGCLDLFPRDEGSSIDIYHPLPETRDRIVVRYESFIHPETGETLYRPV